MPQTALFVEPFFMIGIGIVNAILPFQQPKLDYRSKRKKKQVFVHFVMIHL